MPATSVDHVAITGLAASGTVDGIGTWNTSVDLDTFTTVPAGATAAIIDVYNTSSSQRWAGVRTPGKTAAVLLEDKASDDHGPVVVPLGAGNTVDFYAENTTTVKFFIVGFLGSEWTWFDIDGTPETITSTSSAWADRTVSGVASGTTSICIDGLFKWRPFGETTDVGVYVDNYQLVKLDGSKRVSFNSSADRTVRGYAASGVTWNAWLGTTLSYTADSTWRLSAVSSAGKALAIIAVGKSVGSSSLSFRQKGSTFDTRDANTFPEAHFAPLDAGGEFEYNIETGTTGTAYVHAWLDAATAGPTITDVNTDEALSPGETATITGTGFGATQGAGGVKLTQEAGALESALTGITWGGDTSITGTVALGGLSYGATTSLVVTDNAAATGSIAVTFVPATGYSYVTLSGYPGTGYVIGEDASPAVVDGDQVEYESTASSGATVTVNADGTFVLSTTDPGSFQYRVRDNTDNTWSLWATIGVNLVGTGASQDIAYQNLGFLGYSQPSLTSRYIAYYRANGATAYGLQDSERQFLLAEGATIGGTQDMWKDYLLRVKGYTDKDLTELLRRFWSTGA